MFLPWLEAQHQQLWARAVDRRLPHALLLTGPEGVGKRAFAAEFARSLLCERATAEGLACGTCAACRLIEAGTHPDLLEVHPPEDKTQILIDQIRDLCAALALKSHAGGYKIAIVSPAEQMNTAAANSLLKTLEEPTDNTLLMLIAEQPVRLTATIRSRCQQVRFPVPDSAVTRDWLAGQHVEADLDLLIRLADGAPLRAWRLAEQGGLEKRRVWLDQVIGIRAGKLDPVGVAAEWLGESGLLPLYWLGSFVADLIRLRTGELEYIKNIDLLDVLNEFSRDISERELHQRLSAAWQAQRLAGQPGVNRQLLLEQLLIEWNPVRRAPRASA